MQLPDIALGKRFALPRPPARPTAQASGLPPNVEPCSPGLSTPSTERLPITADTGMIPPPSALPSVYRSARTPAWSSASSSPVRPRPDWISSAIISTLFSSQIRRTAAR